MLFFTPLIMKITYLLTLLVALGLFAGCSSNSDSDAGASAESAAQTGSGEEIDESVITPDDGPLMDQYLSGEIPGYDDE